LVWEGIVLSSWAGAKGGLGALGLAKQAREKLTAAMKIDPNALQGSAYTSLGTLYHKVPGFPIGFGDDKKARDYLERAVQINPDGLDSNYFYGEFLFDKGDYTQAKQRLEKALAAPPRTHRELADAARKKEVAALLSRTRQKLS
jgi:Tfp pilus assembly protein PilF